MGRPRQGVDQQGIVPSDELVLLRQACPDLDDRPRRWQYEAADLAPGTAIVATFTPFLLDLLRRKASQTTFNRDRSNLWLFGGEIIRRRHDDPTSNDAAWRKRATSQRSRSRAGACSSDPNA